MGGVFIDVFELPSGWSGDVQLMFLLGVYSYILYIACSLISEGADLLMLTKYSKLVGSCVLPVLGAVPDGAIVLFSGIGPEAQTQLKVGIGALAGSTVMLLTIPWVLAVYGGRVDIDAKTGDAVYQPATKGEPRLTPSSDGLFSSSQLLGTGVGTQANPACIKVMAWWMVATSLPLVIIQLAAFVAWDVDDEAALGRKESIAALVAFLYSLGGFFGYLFYQWRTSHAEPSEDDDLGPAAGSGSAYFEKKADLIVAAITKGHIGLVAAVKPFLADAQPRPRRSGRGAFSSRDAEKGVSLVENENASPVHTAAIQHSEANDIAPMADAPAAAGGGGADEFADLGGEADDADGAVSAAAPALDPAAGSVSGRYADPNGLSTFQLLMLKKVLRPFFSKYDADKSGIIALDELNQCFVDLGERKKPAELNAIFKDFDADNSGGISFSEFVAGVTDYVLRHEGIDGGYSSAISNLSNLSSKREGGGDDDDDDEPDELPEDLKELSPAEQQKAVLDRAGWMLFWGTTIVLVFSDPLVDVLDEMGDRSGIPDFFVAFVLAPIVTNGSELLASYTFALKKTSKSIVCSFEQLYGAAVMNNTYCVGIFMVLIYVQGLYWSFTAETIAILFVEIIMVYFAYKRTHRMIDGFLVVGLYPLALGLVAFLMYGCGLE